MELYISRARYNLKGICQITRIAYLLFEHSPKNMNFFLLLVVFDKKTSTFASQF
jgi:hypothetical protein